MTAASSVGVLGLGRFGQALANSLQALGVPLVTRTRSSGPPLRQWAGESDVWCLAVRDDQIEAAVAALEASATPGKTVLIHAGSVSLDALEPLRRRGARTDKFHPLQSFSHATRPSIPPGTPFAYEGEIEQLVAPWVAAWQGTLYPLHGEQWPVYHLAAVIAANFLPLFIRSGADILAPLCGGREEALAWLAPLVRRSVEGALEAANPLPFSGPAVRGDLATLAAQEARLEAGHPELAALYRTASRLIARAAGAGQSGVGRKLSSTSDPRSPS